jgi:hypothetical protein
MGNRNDKDESMKMTRAEKRRRKVAKLVEMKLDGVEPPADWRTASYDDLFHYHRNMLFEQKRTKYYGKSLMDHITNHKAQELQRAIDRQIMEELNGKHS